MRKNFSAARVSREKNFFAAQGRKNRNL